jgi:anti-sigma B factor antagonist
MDNRGEAEVFEDLQLTVDESSKSHVVVTVRGELDVAVAPQLREVLMSVAARMHEAVILDLGGVEFIDSSALGAILGAWKQIKAQDGSMVVVSSTDRITRIFEITGLSLSFPVCGSMDQALAVLGLDPERSPDEG